MTDWEREFAEGNARLAEQSAADRECILATDIGSCSIAELEELKSAAESALGGYRECAVEAEQLLASEPLKWTAEQLRLYEIVKENVRFEEQLIAGLTYAIACRRYGTKMV